MISIRDASEKDIPIIQDIAEKTWWPTYGPFLQQEQIRFMLDTIYSKDAIAKAVTNKQQNFLLILEEVKAQGFASYSRWEQDENVWKINKLYVLPENQGKGLGKLLIQEIAKRAKENGLETLVLNVNRHNNAFQFYKRLGFTILREEDIPIGPYWMNDYVMRLSL